MTTENAAGIKVLTGVETVEVEWQRDENGAWKLIELPGTIKIYDCDLCILAMGFLGPEKAVIEQLQLSTDPRSNIKTPNEKFNSNVAKVCLYRYFLTTNCRCSRRVTADAVNRSSCGRSTRVDRRLVRSITTLWARQHSPVQEASSSPPSSETSPSRPSTTFACDDFSSSSVCLSVK